MGVISFGCEDRKRPGLTASKRLFPVHQNAPNRPDKWGRFGLGLFRYQGKVRPGFGLVSGGPRSGRYKRFNVRHIDSLAGRGHVKIRLHVDPKFRGMRHTPEIGNFHPTSMSDK